MDMTWARATMEHIYIYIYLNICKVTTPTMEYIALKLQESCKNNFPFLMPWLIVKIPPSLPTESRYRLQPRHPMEHSDCKFAWHAPGPTSRHDMASESGPHAIIRWLSTPAGYKPDKKQAGITTAPDQLWLQLDGPQTRLCSDWK